MEDLMFGDESVTSHPCQCSGMCKDEFAAGLISLCLRPRRVAVNIVQDHDILVAKAQYCREKSGLICIHERFYLVFRDENVILFLVGNIGWCVLGRFSHFC